jgi:hypothetical protein
LFDQVKNTNEFRSQYGNWDVFAAAQHATGTSAMADPLLYKEYQAAFYNAFADVGIVAPTGMERQFLASGETTTDFTNHIEQFSQQAPSYQWQTGQQADLATTAGVGDKTAGGDIRKKLAEALQQHRAFAESKYQPFQTQEVGGKIAQNI